MRCATADVETPDAQTTCIAMNAASKATLATTMGSPRNAPTTDTTVPAASATSTRRAVASEDGILVTDVAS
jgi:hypothetical protein